MTEMQNDDSLNTTPQPPAAAQAPATLPAIPQPGAPAPASSRRNLLILAAVVVMICACMGACVVVFGSGALKVVSERPKVERVIDAFMRALLEKDAAKGYALWSTRAKRTTSLADIEEFLEGNNFILIEGYRSLTIQNINISATANTNQDIPQGTVATVDGSITYDGGITGSFRATLEREEGVWMLAGMHITVPPSKFGP